MKIVTTEDKFLLRFLRQYRTLNLQLIFLLMDDKTYEQKQHRLKRIMILNKDLDLIDFIVYKNNKIAITLSTKGFSFYNANILKNHTILNEWGDKIVLKTPYREYVDKNTVINHNIHLNYFVILMEQIYNDNNIKFEYYPEMLALKTFKFTGKIRPDGLFVLPNITTKGDRSLSILDFMEMDMSTESVDVLFDKWEKYNQIFAWVQLMYGNDVKAQVTFIHEEEKRKFSVIKSLLDSNRFLENDKEIFLGTKNELYNLKQNNAFGYSHAKQLLNKYAFEDYDGLQIIDVNRHYIHMSTKKIKDIDFFDVTDCVGKKWCVIGDILKNTTHSIIIKINHINEINEYGKLFNKLNNEFYRVYFAVEDNENLKIYTNKNKITDFIDII